MEWKTFTQEECDKFTGATAILGQVVAICSSLYEKTQSKTERAAIVEFQGAYVQWRNRLSITDEKGIQKIYDEVKPIITGESPLLTIDYILHRTRHFSHVRIIQAV